MARVADVGRTNRGADWQTSQVWQPGVDRVGKNVSRAGIKRLVRDPVIERSREVLAVVANDTDVRAKSPAVVAFDPRIVVGDVVRWRRAAEASREERRREHAAEGDRVVSRVALVRERRKEGGNNREGGVFFFF